MDELRIQSHRGPYTVRFGRLFEGLECGLASNEHLIIDSKVAELYAKVLAPALEGSSVLRIDATEANKSLERLPAYVTHLIERGIKRDHVLVAVGGGIIQDITAFIAATLLRGVPWRFYPTTLLAQADSCIGSKSSINIGPYKNQLGTFTPPEEIHIGMEVLGTLSEADIRSGIGEMIKVHIIAGWAQVRAITADYERIPSDPTVMRAYIRRSLELKQAKVEADEFDCGERLVMNYGHSFGHAIESATAYAVPHGIAVTIGMDMANYLSWQLGLIDESVYRELHVVLSKNSRGFEDTPIPEAAFFDALARDKKHRDTDLSLVLMRGPGQVFRGRYANDARFRELCRDYVRLFAEHRKVALCHSP